MTRRAIPSNCSNLVSPRPVSDRLPPAGDLTQAAIQYTRSSRLIVDPSAGTVRFVRNGVPTAGVDLAEVVSRLRYHMFGPVHRNRVLAALDYHCAAGRVAGTLAEAAARDTVTAATRRSHLGEDHLSRRVRIARTPGENDHHVRPRCALSGPGGLALGVRTSVC